MPKKLTFCFENVWLREKDCVNVVKNGRDMAEGMNIMEKIRLRGVRLQE